MQNLLTLINSIKPMNEDFTAELKALTARKFVSKGNDLLKAGSISDRMYFIETGLVRGYYLKDGKDITTGFIKENGIIISPVSFYTRQPTFEYIETVEDSVLWSLTSVDIGHLYERYPLFNFVGRIITEQYYVRSELRAHHLRNLTAEERCQNFFCTYQDLLNRVSSKHIASFLGITPETYSRIRAKR